MAHLPPLPDGVREILTCPISYELMRDPVLIVQSGKTVDRESLFQWLLINPTRCPVTGQDFGERLMFDNDLITRQLLILSLGEDAFHRYDDSAFLIEYLALDEQLYWKIASRLYGMNQRKIDLVAALGSVIYATQDAIVAGFEALLLHPDVFSNRQLEKNENQALHVWRRAEALGLSVLIDAGYPWALWLKGMFVNLVVQDFASAKNLFQRAADQDFALALYSLGELYEAEEQYYIAEKYYEQAAELGHADAQYKLAMRYEEFELMKPHLEKAAVQDHPDALCCLGNAYIDSNVVEQSYETAARYFKRAARRDHPEAEYNLGRLYKDGNGVKQDFERARHYFERAAEQDYAPAQYVLGLLYNNGEGGVQQDFRMARHWYDKAVAQEYALARSEIVDFMPAGLLG